MKSTGIIRKVDELGRIVLPIELRRTLDIEVRDEMEIYIDDDKIEQFFDLCAIDGVASPVMLADALGVSETTVKKYRSKKFEYVSRKGVKRVDG